jgi:uncharacterized protein YneF (UPF0154 family)
MYLITGIRLWWVIGILSLIGLGVIITILRRKRIINQLRKQGRLNEEERLI